MDDFRIPLGTWVKDFTDFLRSELSFIFDGIGWLFRTLYSGVDFVLGTPPFWVIGIVFVAIAILLKKPFLALGTAAGVMVVVGVNQWANAMESLSLVIVAAFIAIALSIPLGIWAARSNTASAIMRPVLDFMQTMPAFVYLIPAILLFRVGEVPGIVATIIFAMAPGVRLTELGIRGVDKEVVEAGQSFGSSPGRILRQIQLPLALPSIMAGINQVIMLSLSMVVIAGMVGAGGLGSAVVGALQSVNVGLGFEAGLAVVLLAIYLDRITGALSGSKRKRKRKPSASSSPKTSDDKPTSTEQEVAAGTRVPAGMAGSAG
ncbi:ABC transporter permease [Humidisolicoccus flavus]|uniref:ABC transporter permease n=1 Tax=Humidisolicoccus flavus TaxID=3111414 RepID=UPI00324A2639